MFVLRRGRSLTGTMLLILQALLASVAATAAERAARNPVTYQLQISSRPLEEALQDPHFSARETMAGEVSGFSGETLRALPLPIAAPFRARRDVPRQSPRLNADVDSLAQRTGSAVQQSEVPAEQQHADEEAQPENVGTNPHPKPLPAGHAEQRRRDRKQ